MTDQRQKIAEEIAASRQELESLQREIERSPEEGLADDARAAVVKLQRDLRAGLIQAWGKANGETAWPGSLRDPIRVQQLPGLLQDEMVETLRRQEIKTHFEVDRTGLQTLRDQLFTDGTALEMNLGDQPSVPFLTARLALALVPGERFMVLLVGMLISQRVTDEEWPKTCQVSPKIGSAKAEEWSREELGRFLDDCCEQFHAELGQEMTVRNAPSGSN